MQGDAPIQCARQGYVKVRDGRATFGDSYGRNLTHDACEPSATAVAETSPRFRTRAEALPSASSHLFQIRRLLSPKTWNVGFPRARWLNTAPPDGGRREPRGEGRPRPPPDGRAGNGGSGPRSPR